MAETATVREFVLELVSKATGTPIDKISDSMTLDMVQQMQVGTNLVSKLRTFVRPANNTVGALITEAEQNYEG